MLDFTVELDGVIIGRFLGSDMSTMHALAVIGRANVRVSILMTSYDAGSSHEDYVAIISKEIGGHKFFYPKSLAGCVTVEEILSATPAKA